MNWLDAAPFLPRLLFGLAAGSITWWSAADLGRRAFDLARLRRDAGDPLAPALGYALVGTFVALLGLLHAISLAAILGAFAVQFGTRWIRTKSVPMRVSTSAVEWLRSLSTLDRCAIGATGFAWITGAVAAALPASWWDPLAYHLPIAARALAQHAFGFDPGMVQTGFPLLGEAAVVPAFAIGGTAGAAAATLGSGIVLAVMCGRWAERISPGAGCLAAALVSCSALWLWLAPSFYVDVPFAMFAVAALSLPTLRSREPGGGWVIVAGVLAGAAAATKYPGLFVVALGMVAVAIASAPRDRPRRAGGYLAAAIATAGGWYARAAMQTGDPLFPFLSQRAAAPLGEFAARYAHMTQAWCGGGTSLTDGLALPWRLMTSPRSFCGDPGYALDLAAIFFLASLALFRRVAVPAGACAALTAFWFFSSQQLRFLVPAVCLFAIAAAVGTTVATNRLRTIAHAALLALCILGVAVNWLPGPARDASNSIAPAYPYLAGLQQGRAYLAQRLEFYGAVEALNQLPAGEGGARVAALDDVRDYYFGSAAAWLNPYYEYRWRIDWSKPPALRYGELVSAGYRYLVVNANDAYLRRTPTGVDWAVLNADVARGVLRVRSSANDVTVYELPQRADK